MMNKNLMAALGGASLLAGCSGGGDGNDGSPLGGEYQQTVKITALDFPGITGEAKAQTIQQMEQVAGGGSSGKFCMKGNDGGAQWKQASSQMAQALGGKCETLKDEGSATSINLEMKCSGTVKGDIAIIMTGKANPQGYESSMTFNIEDPNSDETAKLAMDIGAERVGDCPS